MFFSAWGVAMGRQHVPSALVVGIRMQLTRPGPVPHWYASRSARRLLPARPATWPYAVVVAAAALAIVAFYVAGGVWAPLGTFTHDGGVEILDVVPVVGRA